MIKQRFTELPERSDQQKDRHPAMTYQIDPKHCF
jgi:hypothetical protein